MQSIRTLLKTTAVRLTLVYTLVFGILAVGLVFYVSYNTGRLLIGQFQATVDEEVSILSRVYRRGGVRRLIPLIERRSRRPGANLYLLSDEQGRIIAGNVKALDPALLEVEGWLVPPFSYQRFEDEGADSSRAIARVFQLPGGLKLLVGRDVGESEQFRSIVGRAFTLALSIMAATGLILWFLIGRRALRHVDKVSRSSERILAGDLSQRIPLSGSGDEFDRLSNNLNTLLARIERLNTGVRNMSDSIAHDLKTPLTRLRNRAEIELQSSKNKKQASAGFQDIIDEADGLIRTFDALLMISQVESGARAASLETLELGSIVRDVHELFEPSVEAAGATLKLQVGKDIKILGNRELLAQAMINVLDNSLKYGLAESNAVLTIALTVEEQHAVVALSDNGPGIPEPERDTVIERFVRGDASRHQPGSGLGLALVDAAVRLHGGTLEIGDNNPGLVVKMSVPLPS